jgi:hypothetical protein
MMSENTWCLRTHDVWEHMMSENTWCLRTHDVREHMMSENTLCLRPHDVREHMMSENTWCLRPHDVWEHMMSETTWCLRTHDVWDHTPLPKHPGYRCDITWLQKAMHNVQDDIRQVWACTFQLWKCRVHMLCKENDQHYLQYEGVSKTSETGPID